MGQDSFSQFKENQRQIWSHFAPIELLTAPCAPRLLRHANVREGQRVLDVGTGTGVVALSAARLGAHVTGVDLTPALLEHARINAQIAEQPSIVWQEGEAEALPFADASFDVVLSQFGHMFAPRAELAIKEMLRVLRPGGTLAFSTWPPEHFVGRLFVLCSAYAPPPPPGSSPPAAWGDVTVVRERLGDAVDALRFERDVMRFNVLSVQHYLRVAEQTLGPARALALRGESEALARFRVELGALASEYFEDNFIRQDYLLTRATKR
jgi:SAM-dependent methyltransferase